MTANEAPLTVVSYGGGTNSTAMLIGLWEREERPDLILFADTGGEKPHTYEHLYVMQDWLFNKEWPQILTVSNPAGTLEQDCLDRKTLPAVAFGNKSCSDHFKLRPQKAYLKKIGATNVIRLIGFDAGEDYRANAYPENRYPLIEWGWSRAECMAAIDRAGIPQPGKSSCFFCPNASNPIEIFDLRDRYPELMARAIAMEQNADLTHVKGLGRRFSWGDFLKWDDDQLKLFQTPTSQCDACYDGD